MNKTFLSMTMATLLLTASCGQQNTEKESDLPLIGPADMIIPDGKMTPEVLYSMARVSDALLSPDGTKVLYGVSYTNIEQNRGNRELFTINIDGTDKKQITQTPQGEQNAVWIDNGKRIAFLSSESGSSQIWVMNADGSERKQISNYEKAIEGFVLSPDETKVAFISQVKYGETTQDIYPDLPKATGRIVDDLMYKHWDEWVETIPHTFWATIDLSGSMGTATDLLEGEPYEAPMKPFGGISDLAWSPDGKQIAYASRKKTGLDYAVSTNSDIYIYTVDNGSTYNLTEGMMGYDTHPTFSPDGTKIAWLSMERDGYESDKNRIFIANLATGEKTYLTPNFDYNADALMWHPNSEAIGFIGAIQGTNHLFGININTKEIRQITNGQYDYVGFDSAEDTMIALRQSMEKPTEVYVINTENGDATEISFDNKPVMDKLTIGKSEPRWVKTTDGKDMLVWVIYPPNFDPNKKYPALLYCQGGPQSMVSQYWSYRWNFQIMAAHDYIIVAPNRRGLPGFGQEWLEQISGDYGGQNMKDYFSAIDNVAKKPYVDGTRLGAVGASYGGFSVFWLAGNHNKRFKTFIAHAGIFNMEQQYLETEEMWFANWDMGGPYWDKSNTTAQRTFANSPHRFVDRWDTPIMVTIGEKDYRILASQGMSAFNAAKLRGIPAEMLIYPDENHWILQPQNGVLFQRRFFNWLDKWLK